MPRVYLGLGSNIERERYLIAGLDALLGYFGELVLSPVYDSAAVGFEGQPFLNMVVGIHTDLGVGELAHRLRRIELEHGRPVDAVRFSARQLDIDILTYGEAVGIVDGVELPRAEILENAFVLCPLAQLAPEVKHPLVGSSYRELWRGYYLPSAGGSPPNRPLQTLRKFELQWRGRPL